MFCCISCSKTEPRVLLLSSSVFAPSTNGKKEKWTYTAIHVGCFQCGTFVHFNKISVTHTHTRTTINGFQTHTHTKVKNMKISCTENNKVSFTAWNHFHFSLQINMMMMTTMHRECLNSQTFIPFILLTCSSNNNNGRKKMKSVRLWFLHYFLTHDAYSMQTEIKRCVYSMNSKILFFPCFFFSSLVQKRIEKKAWALHEKSHCRIYLNVTI